jgi:hypothetical protein
MTAWILVGVLYVLGALSTWAHTSGFGHPGRRDAADIISLTLIAILWPVWTLFLVFYVTYALLTSVDFEWPNDPQ